MTVFDELGDGVFRRRYESLDLNIGVVLGTEAVLLVDSRASHRQADQLRAEIETLTALPIGWVVNTHFHWDHTWGNARFPEAALWGHKQCRQEMVANGEQVRQDVLDWIPAEHHEAVNEVLITPPTNTFSEQASIDIGRKVDLTYYGRGHTNSDIVVGVDNVLFVGDLVEEGAPPSFGDSYPLDWATTLSDIELLDAIVPGHGDVVDRVFVAAQCEELRAVADLARKGHRQQADIEHLSARGPFPPATMRIALARSYAQLDDEL
ncbi:MAG: MBL fold metallo-hydrolase [Acidimicrobiia bacterium]|nr:MBL fold metallo-hydrolase [Acidimicrobiia bacterium]